MAEVTQDENAENSRIVLALLESVERDGGKSQRRLAADLGIALGLVNAYVKRCINKGLLKVREAPARRYAYYLTPQGFAEKSRLTVEYLSYSFGFFRRARSDCVAVLETARTKGFARVVLAGKSDLAEIAAICGLESNVEIVAVIDKQATGSRFAGLPVVASFDDVEGQFDAVIVTSLIAALETYESAVDRFGPNRVLVPGLLRVRASSAQELAS